LKLPGWLGGGRKAGAVRRPAPLARHLAQARQLLEKGAAEPAIEELGRALELDPRCLEAARGLAMAWSALEDRDQAEYFCRLALGLDPEAADLHLLLGDLLRGMGRHQEALECVLRAVRLAPAMAQARNNLGNAYWDLGRGQEALAAFREALRADPALWETHFNLAIALQESGAPDTAEGHYRAALERNPGFAQGWLNLGLLHYLRGDLAGAMAHYDRAIAARPDFAEAHVSRALQRLATGDFAAGWEEYEWRLRLEYRKRIAPFPDRPRWDGGAIAGKRLLLYGEQGFGDTLQFFRYAPLAAGRGADVLVLCQPDLKPLLAATPGIAGVIAYDEPVPDFDVCCPLLSLPRLFGTTLRSVPAQVPYVQADPGKVRYWAGRLAGDRAPMKAGLVWSSGPKSTRSVALRELAPLGEVGSVFFYSLQRGEAGKEASQPPAGLKITDFTAELRDFSDNAALLANLDLLISVDTSVAHLAGAMGRPVWTLHNDPADWRWLLEREDSPWYPTMRLFRAQGPGQWAGVVSRVVEALASFVASRRPAVSFPGQSSDGFGQSSDGFGQSKP
jgi:tetratricopeptide (TPR) repeat protein